jgi:D-3-phosphoglycerate dehydrogenase
MSRVLVTEEIADAGLDVLRDAGHEVDVRLGLSPEQLAEALVGAHALLVRSATTVDATALGAANDLVIIGRAGVGLDNVDVTAASAKGVLVANAPFSNIVSAAEHTVALILALARHIPQAHSSLIAGRWERSRWEGVELQGKTLGVVGFGKIGRLVAERARAFGMTIVTFDPAVSPAQARDAGATALSFQELCATSDFITVHLPKNKDTVNLFNAESLAQCKPGVRLINVARGGIINESDLAAAITAGHVAGAAVDVYASEPCTDSPLFSLPEVVATPHLGASTAEAQDKAGVQIAEQIVLGLAGDAVPCAVNTADVQAVRG